MRCGVRRNRRAGERQRPLSRALGRTVRGREDDEVRGAVGVAAGAVIRSVTVVVPCASTKTSRGKSTHDCRHARRRKREEEESVRRIRQGNCVGGRRSWSDGLRCGADCDGVPADDRGGRERKRAGCAATNERNSVPVVTSRDSPGVRPEMSVCQVSVDEVVPKASGRVQTSVSNPAPAMISSGGMLNEFART